MKSEDHSDLPHHRHRIHQKRLVALAFKKYSKPVAYLILLLLAYALGYASHSQPRLSQAARDLLDHNNFLAQCSSPVPPAHVRQTILNRVFNGTSPWENFPPDHVKNLLLPDWKKGWGSHGAVFENLIRRVRPKTIIEVGSFLGASATHMAELTRKLGLETQIICIDDFRGWPGYYDNGKSLKLVNGDSMLLYQFMKNVVNVRASESIMFLPFSAGTALVGLCDWGFTVTWSGGVLFGHDYFLDVDNYGVRRAVDLFARLNGFRVEIDGEHWVLA
ncbi:hypothetical protein Sango_0228100 [Sesamum angolense]|uniref:S-adenosyl-L-methionine-dependent methyltransferase n=1 Tax=Sesamum angolense TaxID=2727404 RepID=A0AAE1XGK9_9LAMI|nr:hypothetical protein Sango_0228100 [Sesamum angolense]